MSTPVFEPIDAAMTASMLADAGRQGLTVVPRGSGTKLAWTTSTAPIGAFVSTKSLNAPVAHFAGDLVATIPSGATLANANAVLAGSDQWLPLDPSHADLATIGGIVATNDSGPRRHKHGSVRDLIIGVEIALCDGRVAKAGGRVVKNVAGYDLSRLMCGSFGSLAVITSATFKLAPLPPASRTLEATCPDVPEAARLALAVAALPVTPSALEIIAPSGRLLIRFETTERAADYMAETTATFLREAGATTSIMSGQTEANAWNEHESSIWDSPGLVARIAVLPTDVEPVLTSFGALDSRLEWCAIGRAALGVMMVRVSAEAADESAVLTRLRQIVAARTGTLAVLRGSIGNEPSVAHAERGLAGVMNAIKSRFDPNGVLPSLP